MLKNEEKKEKKISKYGILLKLFLRQKKEEALKNAGKLEKALEKHRKLQEKPKRKKKKGRRK